MIDFSQYRQLFNPVKLAVFSSFFGRQLFRQRSDHHTDCIGPCFFPCAYISDLVWQKAVQDGFSFTFVVWCLPFIAYRHMFILLKVNHERSNHRYKFAKNASYKCFYYYILQSKPKIINIIYRQLGRLRRLY